jgi:peptide/nickel transport system ATP-binding protein
MRARRKDLQIIFQDPFSSMNPRMLVGDIIAEGLVEQDIDREARRRRVEDLLKHVGLPPEMKTRYPHEFSGGQRQRIAIARTLAVKPKLIICDEPTSALDVSVQAQILNLLKELQRQLGLTYLFITHNISIVAYLADEIAVMYLGRIVEYGSVDKVLNHPQHPYTRALLSAVPQIDPDSGRKIIRLEGDMPSPSDPPDGCHFHPRCPQAIDACMQSYPEWTNLHSDQKARCIRLGFTKE